MQRVFCGTFAGPRCWKLKKDVRALIRLAAQSDEHLQVEPRLQQERPVGAAPNRRCHLEAGLRS